MTLIVAAGVLAFTGGAEARPSTTGPWVVKDEGNGRAVVAGYRTRGGQQNLRALIRAWGPPVRIGRPGGSSTACVAIWKRPRVRVDLANYGFKPRGTTACSPRVGRVQFISTIGPLWRTDRGLRIGDGLPEILSAYPDALDRDWFGLGTVWLLRPYETTCIGDCETATIPVSAIIALIPSGRIRSFHSPVGAAGD